MRSVTIAAAALAVVLCTSCGGGGSTEQQIINSLEAKLQSVAGDWTGIANSPNTLRLDFTLQEGPNGQVSGAGTMKADSAAAAIPITVTGTFQRPVLSLAFDGMVVESRQVKGVAQGSNTTVGGIATTLTLTAPGYSRDIAILLQEK